MSEDLTPVGVRRTAQLHQVCVLVLGSGADVTPLEAAIALTTAPTRIVVVDCINIDDLPRSAIEKLIEAAQRLAAEQHHLIVVNAPEADVAPLREHGIDVATTTDRAFVVDPETHPDREAFSAMQTPAARSAPPA
jgi:hypothetical protein